MCKHIWKISRNSGAQTTRVLIRAYKSRLMAYHVRSTPPNELTGAALRGAQYIIWINRVDNYCGAFVCVSRAAPHDVDGRVMCMYACVCVIGACVCPTARPPTPIGHATCGWSDCADHGVNVRVMENGDVVAGAGHVVIVA